MNLELMCEKACEVARKAGEFIRNERLNFSMEKVEVKGLHDYVSYVDKEAEKIIVDDLHNILPEAGFLTEEATVIQSENNELRWVVDPLDGTTNYIHGLSPYAVSIALVNKNKPIVGVIHVVESEECFYAWQGGGSWLNGISIHVSQNGKLSDSLLIVGFPYKHFANMDKYMKCLEFLMKTTHGVRRLGSAAADLAYIACGRSEGFYEYGLKPWDVAAGCLLVKEAGGIVSDYSGSDNYLFGKELIASNKLVYKELKEAIKTYMLS